jgi:tetratricopeptide (TPR) repeat protein
MTGSTRSARAQNDDVACKDRRGAKKDFNKGRLAYRRGDYEEAILKWQESYASCAEPLIHLNIANAYERLGDLKPALSHLKMWRQVAPLREHSELDARIKAMEDRIAQQDRDALAAQNALRPPPPPPAVPQPPPSTSTSRKKTWNVVGFSLVGVGGAAAIAGVVMDIVAASSRPDEATACTDTAGRLLCRESQRDEIESSNTLALAGDITWIAGAVVAATGGTLLLLNATGVLGKERQANVDAVQIDLALSATGLSLVGAF